MKKLRTVSVKITEPTLFHLSELAMQNGYGKNIGRVIDKLTREKMLSLHTAQSVSATCVYCGCYAQPGRSVCKECEGDH